MELPFALPFKVGKCKLQDYKSRPINIYYGGVVYMYLIIVFGRSFKYEIIFIRKHLSFNMKWPRLKV